VCVCARSRVHACIHRDCAELSTAHPSPTPTCMLKCFVSCNEPVPKHTSTKTVQTHACVPILFLHTIRTQAHKNTHAHIHIHLHKHTHMHINTHTQTHMHAHRKQQIHEHTTSTHVHSTRAPLAHTHTYTHSMRAPTATAAAVKRGV
jgi:hypothetical protein